MNTNRHEWEEWNGAFVLPLCIGFCMVLLPITRAEKILSEGDSWHYFKGAADPGASWMKPGFDDSQWLVGPSGFGYGDFDDNTPLYDMRNRYATVFTRRTFTVSDQATVRFLTLAVDYDDGFAAFLNGVEVTRRNLPGGPINHTTLATQQHEASVGNGEKGPQPKEYIALDPRLLVSGENLIAVSGHNVSLGDLDLSLIVELFTNVTLTRGPYIQMPTDDAVTIIWRTDAETDSVVEYGLDTACKSGTMTNATPVREHVVNLVGLEKGTNYFYRIQSGGVLLSEGNDFKTKRRDDQPFRFAVIGDFGAGTSAMTNVGKQVNAANVDLLLTVGDNIYDEGQPGFYDSYWFSLYAPTMRRAPTFPVLGNHDVLSDHGQWFTNFFYLPSNGPAKLERRHYSFDYGSAHFTALESNPFLAKPGSRKTAETKAIKEWLAQDLAATKKLWKFVYFHHPAYASKGEYGGFATIRTNLMPILEAAGVQMLFVGHEHFYERFRPIHNVHQVITGAAGQWLYSVKEPAENSEVIVDYANGFTLVEINDRTVVLQQIDEQGRPIDRFQLTLPAF